MISNKIKKVIEESIKNLKMEATSIHLEHPEDLNHGDYSTNIAFIFSKILEESPKVVAEKIKQEIEKNNIEEIEKVEIAGPGFINFFLSRKFFSDSIKNIIEKGESFGKNNSLSGEVIEIEHTSPNPNKAMHLGHLRNNVTGMAIGRLLEWNGAKVIFDAVDNNRGIAIAKLMWGYLKFGRIDGKENTDIEYWNEHRDEWQTSKTQNITPDKFVDAFYIKGSEDFKNVDIEKIVRDLVVRWESKDQIVWGLWEHVLGFAYEGQNRTLKRLDNRWDFVWHESDHYEEGKKYVEEGLKKGVFKKLDDGAILTNLSNYNLSDTIVQKSDGTSLYITQDISLTKLKKEKWNPSRMLWVIGPEQTLAMRQMFAICDALGIGKINDFSHISYGYMSIKGKGKMSSREGTVIYIDDLIDLVKEEVSKRVEKEIENKKEEISEIVALGAIKWSVLKVGRTSDTEFDLEKAVELNGDSGPYIQYGAVRASSLINKAVEAGIESSFAKIPENCFEIEKLLFKFEDIVEESKKDFSIQKIPNYLTDLVSRFNSFYNNEPVLDDENYREYKISVIKAFKIVVENALTILGIKIPEKM